jgi:hypothetical protein
LLREDACASDKVEMASFTEFLKNVVDVNFNRAWTKPQFASDILVRQTATNQKRDFVFSRTQYSRSVLSLTLTLELIHTRPAIKIRTFGFVFVAGCCTTSNDTGATYRGGPRKAVIFHVVAPQRQIVKRPIRLAESINEQSSVGSAYCVAWH